MTSEVIIVNKEDFEKKKKAFVEGGKDKVHVISDFDRTLSKAFVDGERAPTVIAQIRNGGYLKEGYPKQAQDLFDHYHPIEKDETIPQEEKNRLMQEWWRKHFDLIIESGMNKDVIKSIVDEKNIILREGVTKLMSNLDSTKIPLVIMSASTGDMVIGHLKEDKVMYPNVHIVANLFKFDDSGKVTGVKEPIIHSHNKNEIVVKEFDFYEELLERRNVILLGDNVGDVGMIEGFDYDNLIKIGFLNEDVEKNLKKFEDNYDVIITNDGSFEFINNLMEEIIR